MTEPAAPSVRVALYARVSTEKQEQEDTIASQVAQLRDYARGQGFEVVDLYEDNGFSGELLARPALDQLRDDAARGRFSKILIHSPDRLARKFVYQELVVDELRKHQVEVEFLNRKIGDSAEDRLLLGIQGLFAEYEKAKIRERHRRGKLHKASKGLIVGGRAPYGYRYVNGSGRYEIVPETARVVRQIFQDVVRGVPLRQVVRELTRREVPRPTAYGRKARTTWGHTTIGKIIHNETYVGTSYYNKYAACESVKPYSTRARRRVRLSRRFRPRTDWVAIAVQPLIDRKTFDLAQERVRQNRVTANGRPSNFYLLRGLVRCRCGAPYVGDQGHGFPVYRCGQRYRTFPMKRTCLAKPVRTHVLEATVWRAIRQALQDPDLLLRQLQPLNQAATARGSQAQAQSQEAQDLRARLAREEDRILDAYRAGDIELEQFRAQVQRLRQQKAQLDQPSTGQPAAPSLEDLRGLTEKISRGLAAADADPAKRQELLRLLVNKIVFDGERVVITGEIPGSDARGSGHNTLVMCPVPRLRFELQERLAA